MLQRRIRNQDDAKRIHAIEQLLSLPEGATPETEIRALAPKAETP